VFKRFYRSIFTVRNNFYSKLRIIHLNLKYPKIRISTNCYIGKNCNILCMDNSQLILSNVYISNNVTINSKNEGKIIINDSFIGQFSVIVATKSIIIESGVAIAEMVTIRDQNHHHNLSDKLIENQGFDTAPIIIRRNVWVGAKVTILKNVEIGKNSIIGAHSLVNKSMEENSVYAGIPAKKIK